jgi:hypothetical protein
MAESITTSDASSVVTQAQQTRDETKTTSTMPRADQNPTLKAPAAHPAHELLCCEVRNCLQIILSGAEILLEDHVENLLTGQKDLLTKITNNAQQMSNLLSTLWGQDEFKFEAPYEARFRAARRALAKV